MRLSWLTDIHFDFLEIDQISAFLLAVRALETDGILISGDIGLAKNVREFLRMIEYALPVPIYFVLGNHDFYGSSIALVKTAISALAGASQRLRWLPDVGIIELSATTALIGHDSWADGRLGNYARSSVELTDYALIKEFIGADKNQRLRLLNALGDEAAAYFQQVLPTALARYQNVVLVTHVPPFREACWHEGRISNDNFLPHFGCKVVGEVLLSIMRQHPDKQLTVLCGHTHGRGEAHPLPNLHVFTGGADYGKPEVQRIIEIG